MARSFEELCAMVQDEEKVKGKTFLCLDPGETMGYASFKDNKLTYTGELIIKKRDQDIDYRNIQKFLTDYFAYDHPVEIICENYRIYSHKLERHSFSPVWTLRIIGAIEYAAANAGFGRGVPVNFQMATQAKTFVTDERLKEWGFYQTSLRHARDAIRHGCYHLLIGCRKEEK